jgi:hypothetical protein
MQVEHQLIIPVITAWKSILRILTIITASAEWKLQVSSDSSGNCKFRWKDPKKSSTVEVKKAFQTVFNFSQSKSSLARERAKSSVPNGGEISVQLGA